MLKVTVVLRNATPSVSQMSPRPGVTEVRLMGQFAGTENRNPAKLTCCHDAGIAGAGPDASATTRGERDRVSTTLLARGPSASISTPSEGTR